ncbi:hypothetical protein [Aeoliella sp.]|uniref:hypothetical protein n=1 Tax=Aeoliella sp. TaxID=2795800 RepID=UPI003CCBB2F7
MRKITRFVSLVIVLGVLSGCNRQPTPEIVPVEGVVLLGGRPLPKATVRFIPNMDVGPEFIASAVTDDQGKFVLECNGVSGAPVGEHTVCVVESDPPEELLGENKQRELAQYLRSLKNRPIPPGYASLVGGVSITISENQEPIELKLSR